jgi:hypothetical protein
MVERWGQREGVKQAWYTDLMVCGCAVQRVSIQISAVDVREIQKLDSHLFT